MSFIAKRVLKMLRLSRMKWIAKSMITIAYALKGKLVKVSYLSEYQLWLYELENLFYLTAEPSWFSSMEYYTRTLRKYSARYYLPESGDIVLDIGAGVGEETLVFSKLVGPSGKVYSIEANPRTFHILDFFVTKNFLKNVILSNTAIAEKDGEIFIEDDGAYGVQNTVSTIDAPATFGVRAKSLDSLVAELGIKKIDLLKANIEGAEQYLIMGMQNSLSRIKHVAISCHDFRHANGESEFYRTLVLVTDYLVANGFTVQSQRTGDPVTDSYIYGTNSRFKSSI